MKKAYLLVIITTVAVLSLAAMAFGTVEPLSFEASVFDDAENWIIRACVIETGPMFSVKFQVIDPITGNDIDPDGIITNGVNGLPSDIGDSTGSKISLAFDNKTGVTYLIYTNDVRHVLPYTIHRNGPKIAVSTHSFPFGSLTTGTSSTKSVTVSNTGVSRLTLGTIGFSSETDDDYTIQNGTGSCANGQVLHPSTDSCTVTVKFAPATAGSSIQGTLVIKSDGGEADVALTGSATAPAGQPDLALASVSGVSTSYAVGQPLKFTMTVNNQGIVPSGAFNVKIYQAGQPLSTWSISNLNAGASVSNAITVSPIGSCSIHTWCSFSVKVDPDNQVTESNESNNSWSKTSYRAN